MIGLSKLGRTGRAGTPVNKDRPEAATGFCSEVQEFGFG
jgi:hypothetical protein